MAASSPLALTPEIDAFRTQFEQLSADADALVAPLSDEQFTWQPQPDAWSVAQCIDHLNATARLYLPMLDEGIADAIRRGLYSPGPFSYNWIGRLLAWVVEPPRGSAPRRRRRSSRRRAGRATRSWRRSARTRCSTSIGCGRPTASTSRGRASASPVASWIRMPLGSGFAMMIAHERRHL